MHISSSFVRTLAVIGTGFSLTSLAMADYTITTPGGTWTTIVGQSFSPSVGGVPDPALPGGATVELSSFAFTSTGGAGNANTRLAILPGAWYDTNGPDGLFTPTIADITAISTNTIDTDSAATGAALNFTFNNAPLIYGDSYSAAFVTVGAGDVLSFVPVDVYYVNWVETSPGTWEPSPNYGGSGNWDRTALYADSNGDGYFEGDSAAGDAAFTATFVVPEPATVAVAALAGMALMLRRR